MATKVLLVDDHQIFRQGLRALLEKTETIQVVAEADNGRMGVQLARQLAPDVVVMDVSMPDLNGIEATRQVRTQAPGARVVALSMHSDRRFVTEMLKAGASGYLLKDCAFEELIRAIETVAGGQTYLSPSVAANVVDTLVNPQEAVGPAGAATLTPRQREVLQLLAEGLTTKQIACRLHLSGKTVETHRQQIMSRLDVQSVAELTKFAIREGLTSLDP